MSFIKDTISLTPIRALDEGAMQEILNTARVTSALDKLGVRDSEK